MKYFFLFLRRTLIVSLVGIFLSVSTFIGEAVADDTPLLICSPNVRYGASTDCGKKNLESLKIGLKKMREMGCKDPRSWYYQGAIHWVPTSNEDTSRLRSGNPLCPYYSQSNDNFSNLLLASWDNCAHGLNQAGQSSQIHFLPWHRLYLDSFEEIVRKLSDDENFSLPYWDYISLLDTKLPDEKLLTMPEEFYNEPYQCNPSFNCNSLYESGRGWRLNDGDPLNNGFAEKNLLNAVEDLKRVTVYEDFTIQIENAPHNQMHIYIGGRWVPAKSISNILVEDITDKNQDIFNRIYNRSQNDEGKPQYGLMANVPSAGFDPIFWMHHGNIDRLWAQWTQLPNTQLVTQQELEKVSWPYQFFELNDQDEVEVKGYTMKEVVKDIYSINYVYQERDGSITNPNPTATKRILMDNQIPKGLKKVLGINQTRTTLGNNQQFTQKIRLNPEFRSQLESTKSVAQEGLSQDYSLEVGVTYTGRPQGTYEVYLNLPKDEEAKNTAIADIDTYFLGTMSFFVLESDRPTSKTFLFNITNKVDRQMKRFGEKFDLDSLSISILKNGGPVDETITVNKLDIYTRE